MGRHKKPYLKARLSKANTQTRWAPFWVVLKAKGKGKKSHPAAFTSTKRSWRRKKLDIKQGKYAKRELTRTSGKINKTVRHRKVRKFRY